MTGFRSSAGQFWKRITAPFVKKIQTIMSCGLTPEKLTTTLCIGTALGVLPLVWGTTLIGIMLAHLFRLNHVVLQSVNYLLYPLQLALLIPFFKLGTWLFPWGPQIPQHILTELIQNPGISSLNMLGWITVKSIAAWLVTVVPLALLAGVITRTTISKQNKQKLHPKDS